MDFTEFATRIQNKTLPVRPVYILYGTESFLKEKAFGLIKNVFPDLADETKYFDADNFSDQAFLVELCSVPFFQERKLVVLKLMEKADLVGKVGPALKNYLKAPSEYSVLVIYTKPWPWTGSGIDAGFTQLVEKTGVVVDCSPIPDYRLARWIGHQARAYGKSIDSAAVQQLIYKIGNDLTLIDEALQKLLLFTKGRKSIESGDVEALVDEQLESEIGELSRAITGQKPDLALTSLERLFLQGESLDKIIGYLVWYFRVKRPDLKRIGQLLKTDLAIKKGLMDPELALRLMIVQISRRNIVKPEKVSRR